MSAGGRRARSGAGGALPRASVAFMGPCRQQRLCAQRRRKGGGWPKSTTRGRARCGSCSTACRRIQGNALFRLLVPPRRRNKVFEQTSSHSRAMVLVNSARRALYAAAPTKHAARPMTRPLARPSCPWSIETVFKADYTLGWWCRDTTAPPVIASASVTGIGCREPYHAPAGPGPAGRGRTLAHSDEFRSGKGAARAPGACVGAAFAL